jgi:hypothetical protein
MSALSVTEAAAAIVALINSRSSSPRADEIEAIIARVPVPVSNSAPALGEISRALAAAFAEWKTVRGHYEAACEVHGRTDDENDWVLHVRSAVSGPFDRELIEIELGTDTKRRDRGLLLVARHEPIGERLHEAHDGIFFSVRQAKAPDFACVHVGGRLRRGPTCRPFASVTGLATRQDVARVVEVHDRLQALEITVVAIRFYEGRIGPLVHVAQRWHPYSRLVVWCQFEPSPIHRGGLAERMPLSKETTDAAINER